jgi:hypothetical protein
MAPRKKANPPPAATAGHDVTEPEQDDEQRPAVAAGPSPVLDTGEGHAGDDDRLSQLLDQYGPESGFRVYLERIEPVHSAGYLGALPFDDQLLENVRARFGGGRFGGRVVDSRSKYLARVPTFKVAGAPRDPAADDSARPQSSQQHAPEQLGSIVARAVADALRDRAPAPADPFAQLTQLAAVLRELRPEPAPATNTTELFTTFTAMLDLRDRLTEGVQQGSGVVGAIREFAPLLRNVLQGQQAETPPPPTEGDPVQSIRRPPAPPPAAGWLRPFLSYRAMLLHLADAEKDPSLYSDVLVDNISDEQAAAIVAADQVDGQLERDLFAAVPELNQSAGRRMFAGKLLQELRAGLYGHGGDDDAPPAVAPAAAKPVKPRKTTARERTTAEATASGGIRLTTAPAPNGDSHGR